ncbi:phosphoenolpyruvate-dependent sugar phosphotransferase system EIIA, probable mannose specific [Lactobacillus johnsonii DPC 6026]|nr:phosphoenolpyruvate-dependent sugar phosphotransferase system EIIA, probable mannose specific [Lactobacillus johnsonii DPC 6026]
MFAGDAIKRVHTLCLYNGESADDFKKKVNDFFEEHSFSSEDEFVILADIIGGSPLTTFLSVFSERGLMNKGVVLGGMNFTMALTATVSLDTMSKEDIAKNALDEARQALKQYEVTPENSTDDDDDI